MMQLTTAIFLALSTQAAGQEPSAPADRLRMALVSMKCLPTDGADAELNRKNLRTNLDRHLKFVDRSTAQGAEFVGFPELSLNGYHFGPTLIWLKLDGPEIAELSKKAAERKVYLAVGVAEVAADGKKWNAHVVLGPDGKVVGRHAKIWLTAEKGHTSAGTDHAVFEVKGVKMGISTCADGSDYLNLKALADGGARIIYGPHANSTGSTLAGWYRFRSRWGGPVDAARVKLPTSNDGPPAEVPAGGWIASLKVHAALHNHAGLFHADFDPPAGPDAPNRFAGGAWFIGPDGRTLAQVETSTRKEDSKESVLLFDVPLARP